MNALPFRSAHCATVFLCACASSIALHSATLPKKMTYACHDMTNAFHLRTSVAPVLSNYLRAVQCPECVYPDLTNAQFWTHKYIDLERANSLEMLPYLVTLADSCAVMQVIFDCASHALSNNAHLLFACGKSLIETTFDVAGGMAILQGIVDDSSVPVELRLRAANLLLDQGVVAGYDLMIEAFDGTNRVAHRAAENLLMTYNRFIFEGNRAATNVLPQLCTVDGTPVDLSVVATHIKHAMSYPFITNNIGMVEEEE